MSMSEFDEQLNTWDNSSAPLSMHIPADFTDEDLAFAQELDALFAVDKEELPPYFVQTLLEAEEPRFQPIEHGFEHKTRARVFRRLKLRRRLFYRQPLSLHSLVGILPLHRSLAACAAFMLVMFISILFTGPSFAAGMQILLQGARFGITQVHSYPSGLSLVSSNLGADSADAQPRMSLLEAQQQLHSWNIYWPQAVPGNYGLDNITLYQEQDQSWIDGPFIELDYSLAKETPKGSGELAIREFKLAPGVSVLQVVKDGAAQAIKVDSSGRAQAIYVDGQWSLRDKIFPTWIYGQRCELIYQQDGIVFWIVGDQKDGMNEAALLNIAYSLQPAHINYSSIGQRRNPNIVSVQTSEINGLFIGDVLAVYPDSDSVEVPYLSVVGSQLPASSKSASKGLHER